MVKIGNVKEECVEFSQALYPESEEELNNIIEICIKQNYPFAVPVLKEHIELPSAITDKKFKLPLKQVVLIFHDHTSDILSILDLLGD